MASMEEVIESLARLEENVKALRQEVAELKESLKDMDQRARSTEKKVFFLWVLATGGLGVAFSVIAHKAKSIFGGQT